MLGKTQRHLDQFRVESSVIQTTLSQAVVLLQATQLRYIMLFYFTKHLLSFRCYRL